MPISVNKVSWWGKLKTIWIDPGLTNKALVSLWCSPVLSLSL
jgi:hypothetical protein